MDRRFDIVAMGEAMVEFNQTREGGGQLYLQGFGGDTSNAVMAAARQGAHCAYISQLGGDDFGALCRELWAREGVNAESVATVPGLPTGIYFVRHGAQGHSFTYRRAGSAASAITPADVPTRTIQDARVLHVSGISQAISPTARASVRHAIRVAREAGTRVSYDPNLRLKLWSLEEAREELVQTLPACDVFLPSLDDVSVLCGSTDPQDILRWSHAAGAPLVVLKLGAQGCLVSSTQGIEQVDAFKVQVVDATGAGDCFDGSFLSEWVKGSSPVEAARWACAAAALSTTGYGAVDPLPSREAVQRLFSASRAQTPFA